MTASQTFTARRLAAAALSAAALVGAAALPAAANGSGPRGPQVEISKVQYDAPGHGSRSNRSLNEEWVQITNSGRDSVNLDDWTLSNRQGRVYTFHHLRLNGHSSVRVHTGVGRDTYRDVYQDRRNFVWDDREDTATLRNDHRRVVDTITWDARHHGNDGRRNGDDGRGHGDDHGRGPGHGHR
ncbi:lamin tail domain-containing protein [Streptomyces sp. NBC_01483]|uniref:lamin tail domain-containing protein n=1 Tax=Streptomyces sp. NBC_01483 TaxID=2903883 RepID=UPI002E37CADF|nr:lamin tail domain-containing protein [Streptomyces sp. NBC_01483]